MGNDSEHVSTLKAARQGQIEARRQAAAGLAKPHEGGQTERMRETFVRAQATIEAIERAIIHEEEIAAGKPVTPGFSVVIAKP